jgi:hypothetical protein
MKPRRAPIAKTATAFAIVAIVNSHLISRYCCIAALRRNQEGGCIMRTFEGAVFTATAIGAQMLVIAAFFAA